MKITSVAMRSPGGRVSAMPGPYRHGDLIAFLSNMGIDSAEWEQGFMRADGVFLNRRDAWLEATRTGQISGGTPIELYSEDIW